VVVKNAETRLKRTDVFAEGGQFPCIVEESEGPVGGVGLIKELLDAGDRGVPAGGGHWGENNENPGGWACGLGCWLRGLSRVWLPCGLSIADLWLGRTRR